MVLLDTHVVLWMSGAAPMPRSAAGRIETLHRESALLVSAVTAWEIGQLVRIQAIRLDAEPRAWFGTFVERTGVAVIPLDVHPAFDASFLPGLDHKDPADRLLIATARALGVPLATRDRAILAYAEATGAVRVLPC